MTLDSETNSRNSVDGFARPEWFDEFIRNNGAGKVDGEQAVKELICALRRDKCPFEVARQYVEELVVKVWQGCENVDRLVSDKRAQQLLRNEYESAGY